MKDLFLSDEATKVANTIKVSPSAPDWGKEALNRFYSDFPELSNIPVEVKFKDKDGDRGYAIGGINLGGQYTLPIIIRDFQLFPFDVALSADKVVPFTKETVQMLLSNKSAFARLSKDEEPDAFLRFFDSPYGYGPGYAMEKGSEWRILETIEQNDLCSTSFKEKVAEALVANPILVAKAERNPVLLGGLQKIASMDEVDADNDADALIKQAEAEIHYIYQTSDGTFTKLSANRNLDVIHELTGLEKHEISNEPPIFAGDTVKTASFLPKLSQVQGYVYKLASDEDIFIDGGGNYRILIGKDYAMTKKAGYDEGGLDHLVSLSQIPETGDVGVIFDPEKGEIRTNVLEMRKVAFFDDGLHRLTGELSTDDAHFIKFATLRGIEKATYSQEKGTMYFPENWVFAKLGSVIPEYKLNDVWNEKLASVEAVRCIGLDHYEFRGPVLRKYAERRDLYDATNHQAAFGVLHCGGGIEDVQKIAELRPGEVHVVTNELTLPYDTNELVYEAEKIASERTGSAEYLFDTADIMKLAADLGADNGVDAVLGTAFLRKDTMNRFIEMLPMFEETAASLAKLVLYIRMGADGVGEIPVREAMNHLSRVIYQLYGVKNIGKIAS